MPTLEPFDAKAVAKAIALLEYPPGSLIPEPLTSALLGVAPPLRDERYDKGKRTELERLRRVELLFDRLLQDFNIMAVNDRGGGLKIIAPADQVEVSRERGTKRVDTALRGMMQEAKYLDVRGFSNAQCSAWHDYTSWLDTLRRTLIPNGRKLIHAVPVETRFEPEPARTAKVRKLFSRAAPSTPPGGDDGAGNGPS
jgi:hypothetical protein